MLAVTTSAVFAELPADWKNVQHFEVAQPGLIKLSLPAATLDAARPGLEDLRIYDSAGHEVPYLIQRPLGDAARPHTPKKFDVKLDGSATIITLETGLQPPVDAILLDTPAPSFIKAATVEGSRDQQQWQTIVTGQPVFRQPNGASQLGIKIPERVWPFLRLTVDDRRTEAVPFTGARLQAVSGEPAPTDVLPVTIAERTENDGQTRLTLDLGARHLTVAGLTFETPEPLFTRPVSVAVRQVSEGTITERMLARNTIYHVAVEGSEPSARLEVPLDVALAGRELLVVIDNSDNQPLRLSAVRATRRPVYAVFLAQGAGTYQVLTGNPRCAAPRYDVAALGGQLKGAAVTPLTLSPSAENPSYRPAEPLPEIQDIGTMLDTAPWSYRKRVELIRAGVQQLDLDLNVLARADGSLRDLRLVREGQQRPYVLERTSISRKLVPQVMLASGPKKQSLSRWLIKLPQRNLPVTRLSCATRTPLFKRQMTLYEEPADERGEKYRRVLGQAFWVRTPPATNGALELAISATPLTDTLTLETDNGDNPAIELENVQLFYPVTRLLFKAPAEPTTLLYYGNRAAGYPQYDLDLIAPRLLAEEKSTATLAAEEELKKSVIGGLFALSGTKSILFWGALALVVVVLLVIISRLLPKPPAT
jgi:hypothetical protein